MRRRMFSALALATSCALLAGAACSTFSSTDTSGPDALAPDAPAAPPEPPADSEPPADGGADVLDADTRFCTTSDATFCDDFDDGLDFSARWTGGVTVTGGTLLHSNLAPVTPPACMRAEKADAGTAAALYVVRSFTAETSTLELAFDLRLDHLPSSTRRFDMIKLSFSTSDAAVLALASSGLIWLYGNYDDAGTFVFNQQAATTPTLGTFAHVVLTLHLDAATASFDVDGTRQDLAGIAPPAATSVRLQVGLASSATDEREPVAASFDDLTYAWR